MGVPGVTPTDLGGGTQVWVPPRHGMGYPPTRQISIASTCYMAGSMPLAFTQEDFLVKIEYLFISIAGFFDWGSKLLDEVN